MVTAALILVVGFALIVSKAFRWFLGAVLLLCGLGGLWLYHSLEAERAAENARYAAAQASRQAAEDAAWKKLDAKYAALTDTLIYGLNENGATKRVTARVRNGHPTITISALRMKIGIFDCPIGAMENRPRG